MSLHVLDQAAFVAAFPEFANADPAALVMDWTMAVQYLSPEDGAILCGDSLQLALNLMTAHLARLMGHGAVAAYAGAGGIVTGASEGSVSVTIAAPPSTTARGYWLSTTIYGMQLRVLLGAKSAGGYYVGGSLERSSFRKAAGVF